MAAPSGEGLCRMRTWNVITGNDITKTYWEQHIFRNNLRQKEENTMEVNRWWAPGADENAISQGYPEEDRLSNLSRNPKTLKKCKLTQRPVPVILVLEEERNLWFCNAEVLGQHITHNLISHVFGKHESATRLISYIRKSILPPKLRAQVGQKVVGLELILCWHHWVLLL